MGGVNTEKNPFKFLAIKPGVSLSFGYLDGPCTPSGQMVDDFMKGATYSAGAMYGAGIVKSVNATGSATELVFGLPGITMDVNYSKPIGVTGGAW